MEIIKVNFDYAIEEWISRQEERENVELFRSIYSGDIYRIADHVTDDETFVKIIYPYDEKYDYNTKLFIEEDKIYKIVDAYYEGKFKK